jgi:peptidoglycan/xylan/chitin deacetylase (PgdA/CDA1 family)
MIREVHALDSFKGMEQTTGSCESLSRTLRRREFLAIAAGLWLSAAKLPAFADDVDSLAKELEKSFLPQRGDSLPPDAVLGAPNREPDYVTASHQLFLTFDDGPFHSTSRILDLLAASGHKATFFVLGRNLANPKLRELALRALKEGHDLGNHSYSHPNFSAISAQRAEQEIMSTHSLIEDMVHAANVSPDRRKHFFRFPYGVTGSASNYFVCRQVLTALDYRVAGWDLDTGDWRMDLAWFRRSAGSVVASLTKARPLDVVLLHDRERTGQHLTEMLGVLGRQKLISMPLSYYDQSIALMAKREREEELDLVSPSRTQGAKKSRAWNTGKPLSREQIFGNSESSVQTSPFAIRHPLETDVS